MSLIAQQRSCALYARDGFRWKRWRGRVASRAFLLSHACHLPDGTGQVEPFDSIRQELHADFVAQTFPMLRTGEDGILLPASAGECSQAIYRLDIGVRRIAQQGRFV